MYVKLRPWDGLNEVLLQVPQDSALHYGSHVSRRPPKQRHYETELSASIDFATIHGVHDDPTIHGVHDDPTGDDGGDYWLYRWVWWWDDDRGIVAAITSGHIFIMSDDGRTVDKVR